MADGSDTTRPRISAGFLRANTCERIVAGTAKVIAEHGYDAATVADITKACGTARNTFYDCFGGKEEAALALVAALEIEIEELSEVHSLDVLLIEGVAMHHAGKVDRAANYLVACEQIVGFFAKADLTPPSRPDDLRSTLPPGRHGLTPDFVRSNRRCRMLEGLAATIVDRGWLATRISDVSRKAAVSRRAFYDQFGTLHVLATAMVGEVLTTDLLDGLSPRSGLYAVAVEILAERLCNESDSVLASKALCCIGALENHARQTAAP